MAHRIKAAARFGLLIAPLSALTLPMAAHAQAGAASGSAGASSGEPLQVQEVVVTAQKRPERLQDVPVSVSVVGGKALQNSAVITLQQMSQQLPGVFVAEAAQGDRLSIRGIGSGDNSPLFDQAVAIFVDGIYHGRSRSIESGFLDVDHIEVLSGPQTTYLGNNAIAGAFNVNSVNPGSHVSGFVRGLYNFDFNDHQLEGAVTVPVSDTLSLRLAAMNEGGDGWIDDVTGGGKIPKTRDNVGRVTVAWEPTSKLNFTLKAETEGGRETGAIPEKEVDCPPPPGYFPAGPAGFCKTLLAGGSYDSSLDNTRAMSPGQGEEYVSNQYSLNSNYDVGPFTLTSVTGYWKYKYFLDLDVDATPAQLFNSSTHERYQQFSEEVRLASKPGVIEYLVGAYYQDDRLVGDADYDYSFLTPTLLAKPAFAAIAPYLPFGQTDSYNQHEDIVAGFGSIRWNVTNKLKLTACFRGSSVDKAAELQTYFGTSLNPFNQITPFPTSVQALGNTIGTGLKLGFPGIREVSRRDDHFSPTANAEYHFSPSAMVYASYSNGFLAGGFNPGEHNGVEAALFYNPEAVNAYEIGAKTQWFDRRLRLNVAFFYDDYTNLQVSASQTSGTSVTNVITNAAGAVSKGIEGDARYVINENWETGLDVSLLDSRYTKYQNASPNSVQTAAGITSQDLSGKPTRFAPDYSAHFDLTYRHDLPADLHLSATGMVFLSDRYNISNNNDPNLEQPAYGQIDFNATVASNQGWKASLILKNLNNVLVRSFGTNSPSTLGSYIIATQPPRSVSLQLRYDF
jgi:iron complex outermembrane receptor protein